MLFLEAVLVLVAQLHQRRMLTSLNVVRMAAVDCDCTSRSATRWRRRDIERAALGGWPAPTGRSAPSLPAAPAAGGRPAASAPGLAPAHRRDRADTSPLVTRPSRPVPKWPAQSRRRPSALPRRASQPPPAGRRGWSRRRGAAATGAAAASRPPLPSVSIVAITSSQRPCSVVFDDRGDNHRRCRNFEHDLVGFDLDQDLVGNDGFAGLLLPLPYRRLGDRFGELRDLDFDDGHDVRS